MVGTFADGNPDSLRSRAIGISKSDIQQRILRDTICHYSPGESISVFSIRLLIGTQNRRNFPRNLRGISLLLRSFKGLK